MLAVYSRLGGNYAGRLQQVGRVLSWPFTAS